MPEDRFPRICGRENRDLRQLLWHRHQIVQARTRDHEPTALQRRHKGWSQTFIHAVEVGIERSPISSRTCSQNEMQNQGNQSEQQQEVNQAAGNMEHSEAAEPSDQQNQEYVWRGDDGTSTLFDLAGLRTEVRQGATDPAGIFWQLRGEIDSSAVEKIG